MSYKVIKKVLTTSSNWTVTSIGQAIATELGMNYDTTNNIMYMGENNNVGFKFINSSSTYVNVYLTCNGINELIWAPDASLINNTNNIVLYHIKTDNTINFIFQSISKTGTSGWEAIVDKLNMCCFKGKNSDNENKWMYLGIAGVQNNSATKVVSEVSEQISTITGGYQVTVNTVSLSPIAIETEDDSIYSDYLFTASQIKHCVVNTCFDLDGSTYMTLGVRGSTSVPTSVVKLI